MSDDSWEKFAQADPYWAVLTNPKYKGDIGLRERKEFFDSGEDHIKRVTAAFERHFGRKIRRTDTALDFGSGVGRLLLPMAKKCRHTIGVDVSATMRRIARDNARNMNISNVECISDLQIENLEKGALDWVNSYIVFQHIRTKIGYNIINKLLNKVSKNGVVSIHVTLFKDQRVANYMTNYMNYFSYDEDGVRNVFSVSDAYSENDMMMNDYDATKMLMIFSRNGFRTIVTEMEDQDGMHGAIFYAIKS